MPRGSMEPRSPRMGRRLICRTARTVLDLASALARQEPRPAWPSSDFPLLNASPAVFLSPLSGLW